MQTATVPDRVRCPIPTSPWRLRLGGRACRTPLNTGKPCTGWIREGLARCAECTGGTVLVDTELRVTERRLDGRIGFTGEIPQWLVSDASEAARGWGVTEPVIVAVADLAGAGAGYCGLYRESSMQTPNIAVILIDRGLLDPLRTILVHGRTVREGAETAAHEMLHHVRRDWPHERIETAVRDALGHGRWMLRDW
jgi:hypothetical protein